MSVVSTHIPTDSPFSFPDVELNNKLRPRQPDRLQPMNPSYLAPGIPSQSSMLNLYPGGHQPQQQPFQGLPPQQQQQQQQPPPQSGHPALGIMSTGPSLIGNPGGQPGMSQQLQHPPHLQQNPQQRMMMSQRGAMPSAPGLIPGNPSQMPQPMFASGLNPRMAPMPPQARPMAQGGPGAPMASMGMPVAPSQMPQGAMRPGPNTRMLNVHTAGQQHDMGHVMGMNRPQPPQMGQGGPPPMMNGLQPNPMQRPQPGPQIIGNPAAVHPMPPQHRPPFQQQSAISPHHAPSPTRPPSSHHGPSPVNANSANAPGPGPGSVPGQQSGAVRTHTQHSMQNISANARQHHQQQNIFPSTAPAPQQQPPQQLQRNGLPFMPDASTDNRPRSSAGPSNPNPAQGPSQSRPGTFHMTPAQTLQQQMQQGGQDFTRMSPSATTPHLAHRMPSQPPLPAPQPTTGRSTSRADNHPQAGPSRTTPRPPSRRQNHPQPQSQRASVGPQPGPHGQPVGSSPASTSPQTARRPSLALPGAGQSAPPAAAEATPVSAGGGGPHTHPHPPMVSRNMTQLQHSLGQGAALLRFMQFNSRLSDENANRLTSEYWNNIASEFFTPQTPIKLTLWKDNERREAKPFEITPNVLSMLLYVSSQSGVRSMSFLLDSPALTERPIGPGTALLDCPSAQWLWRFHDGHVVSLRGSFTAQLSAYANPSGPLEQMPSLRFDSMTFDSNSHEKLIRLDALRGVRVPESSMSGGLGGQKTPATTVQGSPDGSSSSKMSVGLGQQVKSEEGSDRGAGMGMSSMDNERVVIEHAVMPSEPVNAFGIPQASMRCLELAESVGQMAELFQYCNAHNIGPQEGLNNMGAFIRTHFPAATSLPYFNASQGLMPPENHHNISSTSSLKETNSPEVRSRPGTSGGPASAPTPTGSVISQSPRQPPIAGTSASGMGGVNKQAQVVSAPTGPSLKRKQADPPPVESQPPSKRSMTTRKKSKAGGG